MNIRPRLLFFPVALVSSLLCLACPAQSRQAVDDSGRVVVFERDIAPMFANRCLECHQGDKAKADFRIDDREAVMEYLVAEDAEGSILYSDYVLSEDPDLMMPPASHGGPLSPAEITLLRVWIDEGADWPEDATVGKIDLEVEAVPEPAAVSNSLPARVWMFQGYFHPAMVHFPIALLSLGGLFVVLGVKWPKIGTQIPLACLLLGSVSAIAASAMGWSFAAEKGYPSYQAGWEEEINSHRWSGMIVSVASLVLAVIALFAVRRDSRSLTAIWKVGLLGLALMVGLVGHQGGELTYGATHYQKAFERLWGTPATPAPTEGQVVPEEVVIADEA